MFITLKDLKNAFFPSPVWEDPREFTYAEEMCSLLNVESDGMTVTKSGKMAYVIELTGKDFSGLDNESIFSAFNGRKSFFDNLPEEISVFSQSHRVKESVKTDLDAYTNPMAARIAEAHYKPFSTTYRTKHYLVFTDSRVTSTDKSDKVSKAVEKAVSATTIDLQAILQRTVQNGLHKLKQDYGAKLLKGDELVSYWAWMLTGEPVYQVVSDDGLLDDILCRSRIEFPNGKDYMIYGQTHGEIFSAWFKIKIPPRKMGQEILNTLFQVQEKFSVYQTFARMEKSKAIKFLEKREINVAKHMTANDYHAIEIESLKTELQPDKTTQFYTRFALEIFGNSKNELEEAIRNVTKALEGFGYGMARETTNREGNFWMRFPAMEMCNGRIKETTSQSAAYACTFANVGEGFDKCSWGKAPVHIKTLSGSVFSWTWHHSAADQALGNTLVVGGSEVGKTTVVTFLTDKCFQYPNFKVIGFDRLGGMQVWTECMKGQYLSYDDIQNGLGIAPLQADNTQINRDMLLNWLRRLTGPLEENQKDSLGKGLRQIMELTDVSEKNLTELIPAIQGCGIYGVQAAKLLEKWLPGADFGHFFNAPKDLLNFNENQLVVFDMTEILESPEVVGPLSYYIFDRIFKAAKNGGGYAVIIDELPKYLRNADFKEHIPTLLQEIRKTDGIFISMVQSADHILRHESAQAFLNNTASFLLFPEPRAMREDYIDMLGLNEAEFAWIKSTDVKSRKVLLKRRGGESVFLDIDLMHLGNLLRVYDSSSDTVGRILDLKREYPDEYVSRFLA